MRLARSVYGNQTIMTSVSCRWRPPRAYSDKQAMLMERRQEDSFLLRCNFESLRLRSLRVLQQGNVKPGVSAVEISDAGCGFATS